MTYLTARLIEWIKMAATCRINAKIISRTQIWKFEALSPLTYIVNTYTSLRSIKTTTANNFRPDVLFLTKDGKCTINGYKWDSNGTCFAGRKLMMIDCKQIKLLSTAENVLRYLLTLWFLIFWYRSARPRVCVLSFCASYECLMSYITPWYDDANKPRLLTLASTQSL